MTSFSGSLTLHAGPTEPELPLEELLLDELLELLDPELPDDPEVPLEPLELELEPVSGVVAESAARGTAVFGARGLRGERRRVGARLGCGLRRLRILDGVAEVVGPARSRTQKRGQRATMQRPR